MSENVIWPPAIIPAQPQQPECYIRFQRAADANSLIVHLLSVTQVYSLTISEGSFAWKEHTTEVDGDIPSPRGGHTAIALPVCIFSCVHADLALV